VPGDRRKKGCVPSPSFPCTSERYFSTIGALSRGLTWPDIGQAFRMAQYGFTDYFEREVLRKRPYLRREWCVRVLENPIRAETQQYNRWRFWAAVPELGGRYLRVVTLEDKVTVHNAFPDRGFRP